MKPTVLIEDDPRVERIAQRHLEYSRLSFETTHRKNLTDAGRRHLTSQMDTKNRVETLRLALEELGIPEPSRAIEIGHAGCLSLPLAFPAAMVVGADIDIDILSNETNHVPDEYWRSVRKKPIVRYYRDLHVRDFTHISAAVPNYRRIIADGNALPFADGSFDLVVTQGQPFLPEFGAEMTRIARPGGHLLSVVEESIIPYERRSVYASGVYEFGRRYRQERAAFSFWEPSGLPLRKLEIPERLKRMERLCAWNSTYLGRKPRDARSGTVFEAFEKTGRSRPRDEPVLGRVDVA